MSAISGRLAGSGANDPGLLLGRAIERRAPLMAASSTQAFRVFSGEADGIDGVFVDVYGPGAVVAIYEGRAPRALDGGVFCATALARLEGLGVEAVYLKVFPKDRSKIGGTLPEAVLSPTPSAGKPVGEALLVKEHRWSLEVRMYDGFSTGLFLDQRDNRQYVAKTAEVMGRGRSASNKVSVLNTFAYTCAFSVAAAISGAETTSVDVSARYLEWGRRNFSHNGLDPAAHRFAKMDTFEFLEYAARKGLAYDVIVLDPPSFASGNKRKGIRAWSSVSDYSKVVGAAAKVLRPRGIVFASTNTQELCQPGRLEREVAKGLGRVPRWHTLPPVPVDFSRERERFAARAFSLE